MQNRTLPKALVALARKQPERVAFREKDRGIWRDISWELYLEKVKHMSLGLFSLGVRRGDRVAIIGENKPEWLYSAMGAMSLGAVFVGIYTTNPVTECEYVTGHSDSIVFICEDEEQFNKALLFRMNTPKLRKIVVWDMEGLRDVDDPMVMSFDDLIAAGRRLQEEKPALFESLIQQGASEEVASIIYTSGTTGMPKGAMITHENYMWVSERMARQMEATRDDETISFLPLNHIYEQVYDIMLHLQVGHIVNFTESTDTVMNDLVDVSPTIFHAVPRIWEKYYSAIWLKMEDATWFKRKIYNLALSIGSKRSECKLSGQKVPFLLALGYGLAYIFVFYKLKERLGFHKVRVGYSAAAPISHDILKYFRSIGIPICEGYGMTETTGTTHASTAEDFKLGMTGPPLPDIEAKLGEDGELLVKTKGMFKGYFKDEKTTNAIIRDGWLHTGDVAEIDSDGYLRITDRLKDLIITAGGKNVAPQYIENLLKASIYINDAVVIGDKRKYLTAILVIDEENVVKWAQDNKLQYTTYASLTGTEEVYKLMQSELDKVNKQLARVENIRKFKILDKKLYMEDGEVTPTMKVKRKFINEQFGDLIESMYRE